MQPLFIHDLARSGLQLGDDPRYQALMQQIESRFEKL
jgi:hypothetical protein